MAMFSLERGLYLCSLEQKDPDPQRYPWHYPKPSMDRRDRQETRGTRCVEAKHVSA